MVRVDYASVFFSRFTLSMSVNFKSVECRVSIRETRFSGYITLSSGSDHIFMLDTCDLDWEGGGRHSVTTVIPVGMDDFDFCQNDIPLLRRLIMQVLLHLRVPCLSLRLHSQYVLDSIWPSFSDP